MKPPLRSRVFAGLAVAAVLAACSSEAGFTTTTPAPPSTTAVSSPTTTTTTTTTLLAPQPTNVLVIGDFGDGSRRERAVAAAMKDYAAATPIAAFVTTGDNLYTDDLAAAWEEPFGWVAAMGIPVFASWGNHDLESQSRRQAVMSAFDPPGRWYETQIGAAGLVVLDANQVDGADQLAWLESTLAEPRDGPLIVAFHQPAFSCARHGSTPAVAARWVPLFETHGVALVLNGHDHAYQRFEKNGVAYVVTGGGGRGLYEIERCPDGIPELLVGDDDHHHFVGLRVDRDGIRGEALTPDGRILDRFFLPTRP